MKTNYSKILKTSLPSNKSETAIFNSLSSSMWLNQAQTICSGDTAAAITIATAATWSSNIFGFSGSSTVTVNNALVQEITPLQLQEH